MCITCLSTLFGNRLLFTYCCSQHFAYLFTCVFIISLMYCYFFISNIPPVVCISCHLSIGYTVTSSIAIKLSLPLSQHSDFSFTRFSGLDIHSGVTNIMESSPSADRALSSTVEQTLRKLILSFYLKRLVTWSYIKLIVGDMTIAFLFV